MRPYRLLALGIATLALAAGCVAAEPADIVTAPAAPAAPTAPEGPDGAPITVFCDMLSPADISEIAGETVTNPQAVDATDTRVNCEYGEVITMQVEVAGSDAEAMGAYDTQLAGEPFTTVVEEQPMGGVDASAYGTGAGSSGLALRRVRLVLTFVMPGTASETEAVLIQLAARVLDRANSLGA